MFLRATASTDCWPRRSHRTRALHDARLSLAEITRAESPRPQSRSLPHAPSAALPSPTGRAVADPLLCARRSVPLYASRPLGCRTFFFDPRVPPRKVPRAERQLPRPRLPPISPALRPAHPHSRPLTNARAAAQGPKYAMDLPRSTSARSAPIPPSLDSLLPPLSGAVDRERRLTDICAPLRAAGTGPP